MNINKHETFEKGNFDFGKKIEFKLLKSKNTKGLSYFLKGPIPKNWLDKAAQLKGKAFQVAVEIRYLSGLTKSLTVSLNLSRLGHLELSRSAASRGLKELEKSGLVSVVREPGRKSVVTIIEIE